MSDTILSVKNLYKLFGANKSAAMKLIGEGLEKDEILKKTGVTVAVSNVSFDVSRGEIFVLIGLSGSGKSTVIRCLNMLHRPTSGQILFDGQNIEDFDRKKLLEYRRKKISMVFQSFGLMSHRDVLSNVTYGLEVRGVPKSKREEKGMELISLVGLEGWENSKIESLSGGMRQRVGIARALASDPDILLMDEPFSALDPIVRRDMQFELLSIQRKLNKTIVFITHDINEAFKMGSRAGIMRDGKLIQIATPEEMTSHPADPYVEKFIHNADKARIFCAKHIMTTPTCMIHPSDGARHALNQMHENGVSSAYVVDKHMRLIGILSLEKSIQVLGGELAMEDAILHDVVSVQPELQISELFPLAAQTRYPIAVTDEGGHLQGIITKAAVLTSLA